MVNTAKIKGRISEKGLTNQETSKRMKMSAYTFRRKINNIVPMTLDESVVLSNILDITEKEYAEFFLTKELQICNNNN